MSGVIGLRSLVNETSIYCELTLVTSSCGTEFAIVDLWQIKEGFMRGRAPSPIELSDEERSFLGAQLRRYQADRPFSDRCRSVLRRADGLTSKDVAAELGHAEHTAGKWRRRFAEHRIERSSDGYRSGRPRTIFDAQVAEIIGQTL
jgi:putative transposase